MEKIIRTFSTHEEADRVSREDDAQLTPTQRLANFLEMMTPIYEATERLQRVYRTRNLNEPEVRDRWRLGL